MAAMNDWVSWFEIPVLDLERASSFYGQIFDCEIEHLDLGELKMGVLPHGRIGGALVQHPYYQPGSQGPLVYLNGGEDLAVVLDRVEAAGGKIVVPKRQISDEHGFMAVFTDTEGNRMALHSTA